MREIENKGKTSVSTPAGTKSANHIQVSLNLEDVKDLVSYTLGNLAEYESLDHIAQQYFNMLFAEYAEEGYGLTEEEITEGVNELRALLLEMKDSFDQFDEEELAAALGFKPALSIDLNYYVTDEAELVKSVMKFDLTLEPFGLPEEVQADPLRFQIESQDVYWNVKGDVELPAFDKEDVYNVLQITSDLQELEKVEEGSVIRQAIEPMAFPRTATIEIGSTWAMVNHEYVALEAAPYIKNGNTMVPVSVVTDIAYTEADWDSETKVITFEFDGRLAVVQIGNNKVYVDDKEFEMFVAPEIKNGIEIGRAHV